MSIAAEQVSKRFGPVQALNSATLAFGENKIYGLLVEYFHILYILF